MRHCLLRSVFLIYLCANVISSYAEGIFQQAMPAKKYQDPKSQFLYGSIYKLYWAEVEPDEGKFNWDKFDKDPLVLATKKRGKKLAVKFQLQGKKDRPSIPNWVETKLVKGTNAIGEYACWPVFWDEAFLEKFDNFLKALAARYDADPAIEFFWFDETALGYPRAEKEWLAAGYNNVDIYKDSLIRICKAYKKYFKKTPLAQLINKFRRSEEEWYEAHPEDITAMWEFAGFLAGEGIYLGTPSFYQSEQEANVHDKTLIWPIYKKYQDKTKIIVMIDRPHAARIKDPLQAMKNLFLSYKVDYLFVDPKLIYNKKWTEAFKYTKEHLERR